VEHVIVKVEKVNRLFLKQSSLSWRTRKKGNSKAVAGIRFLMQLKDEKPRPIEFLGRKKERNEEELKSIKPPLRKKNIMDFLSGKG
jgi:hypothetical protein